MFIDKFKIEHGSVKQIIDCQADVVKLYTYNPFGEPSCISDIGNPYKFTGRRYDDETGLYYYRARYYKPEIGRFMSPDPIGYWAGINLYAYCDNTPINWIDPTGNSRVWPWPKGKWKWYDYPLAIPHALHEIPQAPVEGVMDLYAASFYAPELGEARRARQAWIAKHGEAPSMSEQLENTRRNVEMLNQMKEGAIKIPGQGSTGNPISVPTGPADLVIPAIQGAIEGGTKDCPKSDDPDDVNKGM